MRTKTESDVVAQTVTAELAADQFQTFEQTGAGTVLLEDEVQPIIPKIPLELMLGMTYEIRKNRMAKTSTTCFSRNKIKQ